ncbi:hypothetical protein FQN55_009642 [Onygenales sp. PD_40]|nr:hypothetical protein FQN55_009642 [Onygenales sp. PD_40]KAK2790441.1 hypothetical protein FQN53_009464 [Emmonsiellopsis sp. PD_33]
MPITYNEALNIIKSEATSHLQDLQDRTECLPLHKSLNRVSRYTCRSPVSTPKWDTSAMDGYALSSEATKNASDQTPVVFSVKATIAAGDEPPDISGEPEGGVYPCVEIMTGARFPNSPSVESFDCCVRVEDTRPVPAIKGDPGSRGSFIHVMKPAGYNQHKRLAGQDFRKGDVIIEAESIIRSSHVMALASIGVESVDVLRKLRVGLFSTGSEILRRNGYNDPAGGISDVNGPYISAALEEQGVDVDFLGVIEDNIDRALSMMLHNLGDNLASKKYDLLITTGGVSAGKFDFIREAVERMHADIRFHKVAMKPGHPVLFASLPRPSYSQERVLFFGLPGNPVAAAACLRFLVIPYLHGLTLMKPQEQPTLATVRPLSKHQCMGDDRKHVTVNGKGSSLRNEPSVALGCAPGATLRSDKDVFRLARVLSREKGGIAVGIIEDHSPGKISPFLEADCWVHISPGQKEMTDGDIAEIYPLRYGTEI